MRVQANLPGIGYGQIEIEGESIDAVHARGAGMLVCRHTQRSAFELLLPDAERLWDEELRRTGEVLDDAEIVERMTEALKRRRPKNRLQVNIQPEAKRCQFSYQGWKIPLSLGSNVRKSPRRLTLVPAQIYEILTK